MATASVSLDQTLADFMADCYADPLAFVLGAYPWGEPGPLKDHPGPDEWQADLLRTIGKAVRGHKFNGTKPVPPIRAAVSSGHGIGKAQPSDAVIPTPDGDRRFGDLCPGGRVWGRDGTPTRVVAVHEQGVLPTYRVRFDDGSEARVTGDHLWSVRGRQQRRNGLGWATMTTKGILNSGVKRPNGVAQARQWEIPTSAAVDLPPVDLPLDPYALGVWLGDGSRCGARFTSADSEVIGTLRNRGMVVVKNAAKYQWAMAGVAVALRVLGVFLNYSYQKRVPVAYINASAEQRAWLLRGLLDTDGECTPGGSVGFSSTSRPLVADVVRLARSLGGKAQHHPSVHKPKYPDAEGHLLAGRDSFRATVTMPDGFAPFTIERKAARVKPVQDRYRHRWIDSIEPDNETDCRCITVAAADGLYLTNDYIVTHNSVMAAWLVD